MTGSPGGSGGDDAPPERPDKRRDERPYELERQIGFVLRRAQQRHGNIFLHHFKDSGLSPVQFAALEKIRDEGPVSQNQLGRLVHMDPATMMGVANRLAARGLIQRTPDAQDKRRTLLSITPEGAKLLTACAELRHVVTAETLQPLNAREQTMLLDLLARIT